jgi:hypothetical protein
MSLGAVLDACTDDVLLAIATALPAPLDLLRLALTCRAAAQRFYFTSTSYSAAASSDASGAGDGTATAAAQRVDTWSIDEEAARRWIAACTDQERGWVPRRGQESWLGLMWEVESLRRRGAVFGRYHTTMTVSEGGALATKMPDQSDGYRRAAASKAVMRAGRQFLQFTLVSGCSRGYGGPHMFFGVIRPSWDVEGGVNAHSVDGHCFYNTHDGCRPDGWEHGGWDWEGMQDAREGDRIGMLLDLDQGTMTVYKNDAWLGVMAMGLSGEYCWALSMESNPYDHRADSVRIEAAVAPPSPTAEGGSVRSRGSV